MARLLTPVHLLCFSSSYTFTSNISRSSSGSSFSYTAQGASRLVSSAVGMPCLRQARSSSRAKSGWQVTSPPLKVTPPPEFL